MSAHALLCPHPVLLLRENVSLVEYVEARFQFHIVLLLRATTGPYCKFHHQAAIPDYSLAITGVGVGVGVGIGIMNMSCF